MAKSLWVRDRGIVTCGRGLVYGESAPPCACADTPGACCIAGVCSSRTFADCLAAGGNFLGGACTPGVCNAPVPSCCNGAECFHPGGLSVFSGSITFSGRACVYTDSNGVAFNQSRSETEQVNFSTGPSCSYGRGVGVSSGVTCNFDSLSADASIGQDESGNAVIRVRLLLANQGVVQSVTIPCACSGGAFNVTFQDFGNTSSGAWTNLRASGTVTMSDIQRCDGIPETGACCYPDLSCLQLPASYESQCINSGGRWLGLGSSCNPNPCIGENGSCCLPDGRCIEGVTEDRCRVLANYDPSYQFNLGGSCADCFGACCLPGGGCVNTSRSKCINRGGTFRRVFPAVPNPCSIPDLCGPPDAACCGSSTCGTCFIPGPFGAQYPSTVTVQLDASHYHRDSCEFRGLRQEVQTAGGSVASQSCNYVTPSASVQMFPDPSNGSATVLSASAHFKSCDPDLQQWRNTPHVVVTCANQTTRHEVPCAGGPVFVTRPNFGQNCGAGGGGGPIWRGISVAVQTSVPNALACGGLVQRPTRIIIPGSGGVVTAATGCSGCGGGGTKGLTI